MTLHLILKSRYIIILYLVYHNPKKYYICSEILKEINVIDKVANKTIKYKLTNIASTLEPISI